MKIGIFFLLKDNVSSYSWLVPSKSACAYNASAATARWNSLLNAMRTLVSDKGAHFKNEVLEKLAADYDITDHFTVVY